MTRQHREVILEQKVFHLSCEQDHRGNQWTLVNVFDAEFTYDYPAAGWLEQCGTGDRWTVCGAAAQTVAGFLGWMPLAHAVATLINLTATMQEAK